LEDNERVKASERERSAADSSTVDRRREAAMRITSAKRDGGCQMGTWMGYREAGADAEAAAKIFRLRMRQAHPAACKPR